MYFPMASSDADDPLLDLRRIIVTGLGSNAGSGNGVYEFSHCDSDENVVFTRKDTNPNEAYTVEYQKNCSRGAILGCRRWNTCWTKRSIFAIKPDAESLDDVLNGSGGWRSVLLVNGTFVYVDSPDVSVTPFSDEHLAEARRWFEKAYQEDPWSAVESVPEEEIIERYSMQLRKEGVGSFSVSTGGLGVKILQVLLWALVCTMLSMAVFKIAKKKFADSDGKISYLSSVDIAVVEIEIVVGLGCILMSVVVASSTSKASLIAAQWLKDGRILRKIDIKETAGLLDGEDADKFDEIFRIGFQQFVGLAILIALLTLNVFNIHRQLLSLPKRNPGERLNEGRHIVAWFEELAVITIILEVLLLRCPQLYFGLRNSQRAGEVGLSANIVARGVPDTGGRARMSNLKGAATGLEQIVLHLTIASSFSVLRAIALLNVNKVKEHALFGYEWGISMSSDSRVIGGLAAASMVALSLIGGLLGVVALSCKIDNVDFVTEKLYDQWTWFEMITLAAFANNIAGIVDLERTKISTILGIVCRAPMDRALEERWIGELRSAVVATMLSRYSLLKSAILVATFSPERWEALLLQSSYDGFSWTIVRD